MKLNIFYLTFLRLWFSSNSKVKMLKYIPKFLPFPNGILRNKTESISALYFILSWLGFLNLNPVIWSQTPDWSKSRKYRNKIVYFTILYFCFRPRDFPSTLCKKTFFKNTYIEIVIWTNIYRQFFTNILLFLYKYFVFKNKI